MKRKLLLACIPALVAMAAAQNPSASITPKPISHYMRETGLLYLENTKKMVVLGLKNPDASPLIDPTNQAATVNSYGEVLQMMEDHIRINITSAADKQYLQLLQRTKAAAELSVLGDLSNLYSDCYAQARLTALHGAIGGGNCTERRYEVSAKAVRDEQLRAAQENLSRATQHLADVESGVPNLTPAQKELCAKDVTYTFCKGTPEWDAFETAKAKAKTEELCAKSVFDKDYCAKFEAAQEPALKK